MKKTHLLNLLAFITLASLYSCTKSNTAQQQKGIFLGGCNSIIGAAGPMICFDSLITDSRCPNSPSIQCVWEGYAAVKLSIKTPSGISTQFSLSTLRRKLSPIPPNDTLINGYHIKLLNLYPDSQINPPAATKYSVELEIN
ncbi:MAG: hypothetical protein WDM90_02800 [Ferruginibacter sp.]